MVIWVKIVKIVKTIEIHLVRLTEVCGKVFSKKYVYKFVKTTLLLSNVIDADHQNSSFFYKQSPFFHHLYGFKLVFELNFMNNTLPISLTRLSEHISTINSV